MIVSFFKVFFPANCIIVEADHELIQENIWIAFSSLERAPLCVKGSSDGKIRNYFAEKREQRNKTVVCGF